MQLTALNLTVFLIAAKNLKLFKSEEAGPPDQPLHLS